MSNRINIRLSVMMFIQYFIWSSWFVTAYPILVKYGFGGNEIKWTYSTGPIAAFLSPLFVGLLADRWFPTQKVLAVMHLMGGLAFLGVVITLQSDSFSPERVNFFILLHMLFYMPTLALTNSITLANVMDSEKHYPRIRFFSGVGWIAAGVSISMLNADASIVSFYLTIGASFVMALYALLLPDTPPRIDKDVMSIWQLMGGDAFRLFKQGEFIIFSLGMIVLFIPTQFYFQLGTRYLQDRGFDNVAFIMSLGQMAELLFILSIPFFLKKYSVRVIIIMGAIAWFMRYGLFIVGSEYDIPAADIMAILVHGACYDFCFIAGMLYIDRVADVKIRSQAQGLFMTMTYGIGMMIGAQVAGYFEVINTKTIDGQAVINWGMLWSVPLIITLGVIIILSLFFRPTASRNKSETVRV